MKKPILYLLATSVTLGAAFSLAVAADEPKKTEKARPAKPAAEEASKPADKPEARKADDPGAPRPNPDAPRGERPGGPPERGPRPDGQPGQPGPGGPGGPGGFAPPSFAEMDADKDGLVSEKEFVAIQVERARERALQGFGFIDEDKSGGLTEEELKTFGDRMRDRMRGAPGQGDRPPGAPEGGRGQGPRPGAPEGDAPPRPQRPNPDSE